MTEAEEILAGTTQAGSRFHLKSSAVTGTEAAEAMGACEEAASEIGRNSR